MTGKHQVFCKCGRVAKWYTTFGNGYVFICECGDFIFVDENFENPRHIRSCL